MNHRPHLLLALALTLTAVACRRSGTSTPPATPVDTPPAPPPRAPVTPTPPSSDALVLSPGEGIGAFSLGTPRAAVIALGGPGTSPDTRTMEIDGVTIYFDADAPGGVVNSLRVRLADVTGGVRVGSAALQNTASYPEVISAVGPCGAPQMNRGATLTPCQDGAVKIVQAGPTQELWLEVSR
jgi:hypothetical protein